MIEREKNLNISENQNTTKINKIHKQIPHPKKADLKPIIH